MQKGFTDGIFTVPKNLEYAVELDALDKVDGKWVINDKKITNHHRLEKLSQVDNEYNKKIEDGFIYKYKRINYNFYCSDSTLGNIITVLSQAKDILDNNGILSENNLSFDDKNYKRLIFDNIEDFRKFKIDIFNHIDSLKKQRNELKYKIKGAVSVKELKSIDIDVGSSNVY